MIEAGISLSDGTRLNPQQHPSRVSLTVNFLSTNLVIPLYPTISNLILVVGGSESTKVPALLPSQYTSGKNQIGNTDNLQYLLLCHYTLSCFHPFGGAMTMTFVFKILISL